MRFALWGIGALLLVLPLTHAQNAPASDDRLNQLEQRLTDLEQKYQADIKARDEQIAQLRKELTAPPAGEIEKTKQDVHRDVAARASGDWLGHMSLTTDFKGNVATDRDNPARNRFDVASVELELHAPIGKNAEAFLAIPVSREVEDPLFFDPATADGSVNTSVEIEEAYLCLHDLGTPNLSTKIGRFHLHFGRWNLLHAHQWPTSDNSFVNQSFLGAEAIIDNGLSLTYDIKPAGVKATVEVVTGEGGEEQPVINNDAFVDSPAVNTHLLWNRNLRDDWNVELGGSWLSGHHDDSDDLNAHLFGVDIALMRMDPHEDVPSQLVQTEMIWCNVDVAPGEQQNAWGAYLLFQQHVHRRTFAGCRLDWTQNALDESQEVWGVSPYVTWYWNNRLRLRAEYQHKAGDVPTENTLYLQATWTLGQHPAHPH